MRDLHGHRRAKKSNRKITQLEPLTEEMIEKFALAEHADAFSRVILHRDKFFGHAIEYWGIRKYLADMLGIQYREFLDFTLEDPDGWVLGSDGYVTWNWTVKRGTYNGRSKYPIYYLQGPVSYGSFDPVVTTRVNPWHICSHTYHPKNRAFSEHDTERIPVGGDFEGDPRLMALVKAFMAKGDPAFAYSLAYGANPSDRKANYHHGERILMQKRTKKIMSELLIDKIDAVLQDLGITGDVETYALKSRIDIIENHKDDPKTVGQALKALDGLDKIIGVGADSVKETEKETLQITQEQSDKLLKKTATKTVTRESTAPGPQIEAREESNNGSVEDGGMQEVQQDQ